MEQHKEFRPHPTSPAGARRFVAEAIEGSSWTEATSVLGTNATTPTFDPNSPDVVNPNDQLGPPPPSGTEGGTQGDGRGSQSSAATAAPADASDTQDVHSVGSAGGASGIQSVDTGDAAVHTFATTGPQVSGSPLSVTVKVKLSCPLYSAVGV